MATSDRISPPMSTWDDERITVFEAADDANVAFITFGSEIEERLRRLGRVSNVTTYTSIDELLNGLVERNVINRQVAKGLDDFIQLRNAAAHGVTVSPKAFDVIQRDGRKLLQGLDALIDRVEEPSLSAPDA